MSFPLCTCNKCGWVHFAVTREYAEESVEKFNAYYDTLTPQQQQDYYGGRGASVREYEGCGLCRGYSFREFKEGDCPEGVTMNPVICEKFECPPPQ